MSANLLLFDDVGNLWDGGSPRLRKTFGSTASDDDFSTYVVKNMGFVAVHGYGRSCEIRLRPRLVTAAAFTGLANWVRSHKFDRIVTAHFTDDWVYGLHANGDVAIAKLEALLSNSQRVQHGDYLMRHLKKDELPRTTQMHQALHSLIENWPMLSQSVHREGLRNIIETSLQGRYTIVDAVPDASELMFREIGSGFLSYNDEWVARSKGLRVEELEDSAYGRWAATGYRQALRNGIPLLCDVDAIMQTPRLGRARIRYKRLLFPSRSIAGGAWLLTSSVLDPTIDLRIDLGKKSA